MEKLFKKLNKIIDKYDNFILMGHRDPDLDALGSSLGLCEIIEKRKKDAYLFLDISHLEEYNTNINVAFDKMEKDIRCINEKTYKKYITENTLLIVTDVHIKERLEYPEILDEVDTVVLDHHIKSKNYIKDTIYTYIDSNLSSMSELITMYALYNKVDLDNVIASILLGGIEIDTNEYNFKTSAQTYEAAKTLMDMGADVILKQELLKETKEEYIKRASTLKNSFMVTDNIAMCIFNECTTIELAQAAEELLNFEDVEASFTVGRLDENTIGISARSIGNINVEKIIKKMGGGGHASNAAAQVTGKTIKEVKGEIKKLLEG